MKLLKKKGEESFKIPRDFWTSAACLSPWGRLLTVLGPGCTSNLLHRSLRRWDPGTGIFPFCALKQIFFLFKVFFFFFHLGPDIVFLHSPRDVHGQPKLHRCPSPHVAETKRKANGAIMFPLRVRPGAGLRPRSGLPRPPYLLPPLHVKGWLLGQPLGTRFR